MYCTGYYVATSFSPVICASYSENISQAHFCFSIPYDTARGIYVSSIYFIYLVELNSLMCCIIMQTLYNNNHLIGVASYKKFYLIQVQY